MKRAALVAACSSYGADDVEPLPPRDLDAGSDAVAPDAATDADAGSVLPIGSTVTGVVTFVNAFGAAATSVILAPEGFDPNAFHDFAPRGPKVSGISGEWTIENVPAGTYVVLAGYEKDGLVTEPGAAAVKVVVSGRKDEVVVVPDVQKLVGALPIVSITPKSTSASVTFGDDSSEDAYEISVINSMGKLIYGATKPASSGPATLSFDIEAALVLPLKYRVRVISKKAGRENTRTEDLAGVFTAAPDDT